MKEDNSPSPSSNSSTNVNTAEQEQGNSWWGGWGQAQGWIEAVKEKSASTLEMVKKDLNEFVDVIQGDTSVAMNETADKLDKHVEGEEENKKDDIGNMGTTEFVKQGVKGLSHVLHSMSELMQVQEPDDSNEEFITLSEGSFSLQSYNRKQEKLHFLQTDPGTYCNEPEGSFNDWLQIFILDENKQDMSNLLTQNSAVRAIYSKLVPDVISHTTFWQRYYFKVFQLDNEERKREELLARAKVNTEGDNGEDDEDGGWGDDDDDDIEIVKEAVPQLKLEKESPQTPTKESLKTPTNESICTPTKDTIEHESVKKLKEPLVDPAVHLTSPLVQSMRGNETNKVTGQENKEKINENQNINEKTLETIESETGLDKSKESQNVDISPIKNNSFDKNSDDTTSTTTPPTTTTKNLLVTPEHENTPAEFSETASVSSWLSIDDDIKVKKIKGEQIIKSGTETTPPVSDGGSSTSSAVLVNKSEADDLDDDDFDIDLDDMDNLNEEELSKMVEKIKNKEDDDDDDDWENWE